MDKPSYAFTAFTVDANYAFKSLNRVDAASVLGVGGIKMGTARNYETSATLPISTRLNCVDLFARRS
jgi:hypothetical protein